MNDPVKIVTWFSVLWAKTRFGKIGEVAAEEERLKYLNPDLTAEQRKQVLMKHFYKIDSPPQPTKSEDSTSSLSALPMPLHKDSDSVSAGNLRVDFLNRQAEKSIAAILDDANRIGIPIDRFSTEFRQAFSEHARAVAGDEARRLWVRVLQQESVAEGHVSARAMALLGQFSKRDADVLRQISNASILIRQNGVVWGAVLEAQVPKGQYARDLLFEAQSLGLIYSVDSTEGIETEGHLTSKLREFAELPDGTPLLGAVQIVRNYSPAGHRLTPIGVELVRIGFEPESINIDLLRSAGNGEVMIIALGEKPA